MASPDSDDPVIDQDLDTRFSDLSMAAQQPQVTAPDNNRSSVWPSHSQSSFSPLAATSYGGLQSLPLNDPNLAAQVNVPHGSLSSADYSHATPYWPPDDNSAQPGPFSIPTAANPFACPYPGCPKSYTRQCDLEYVTQPIASQPIPSPPPPNPQTFPYLIT